MNTGRKFLSFALALMIALAVIPSTVLATSDDAIRITVNGVPVSMDTAPFVDANGRTMVPVRFISEALHAGVQWDASSEMVTVTLNSTQITLQIGSRVLSRNGIITMMDTEAAVLDSRTFVPVRFIAEALGLTVGWDSLSNTVSLIGGDSSFILFSSIAEYDGKIYSIFASPEIPNPIGIKGSARFTPLPEALSSALISEDLYIDSFAFYEGKIYCTASKNLRDADDFDPSGGVYRCNLDGSGLLQVYSAPYNYSYSVYLPGVSIYDGKLYSGMTAVDLNTLKSELISEFPIESMEWIDNVDPVYQGYAYYILDRTLYKREIATGLESTIMTLTAVYDYISINGYGIVMAVVNDTVYYAALDADNTVCLYGISVRGGNSTLLASWSRNF